MPKCAGMKEARNTLATIICVVAFTAAVAGLFSLIEVLVVASKI